MTGDLAEFLAVSAGTVNGLPVGVLTFRPHATQQPLNLMITRSQLERLREDIAFLLERSPTLKDGPSPEISLAELEACMATIRIPGVLPQRGMLPEIAECSIEIATGNAHSSAARMSIPCCGV